MTSDPFAPGTLYRGKYRVERVLGAGGMGVVVLATHLRMAQLVAIKVLTAESREQPEVVARFAREARAADGGTSRTYHRACTVISDLPTWSAAPTGSSISLIFAPP